MIQILYVLIATSVTCGIIGIFLVLRNLSMISDAISHSTVLGIAIAFIITYDLDSPLLVLGAGLFGVLTVYAIELLIKTKLVKEDAATGIVFSLFFSTAIIIISRLPKDVHLCSDMVIMGEVIFAPLNTMSIFGYEIPKALVYMGIMFIINSLFIFIFYKELKITSFDRQYALLAGFSLPLIYYSLMTLISLTAVTAFESVGGILVISFLVTPSATAYLITKKLSTTIILTALISIFNSTVGYYLSIYLNVNVAGMVAFVAGVTFLLTMFFNKDGVIRKAFVRRMSKVRFYRDCLVLHLGNHCDNDSEYEIKNLKDHFNWNLTKLNGHIKYLVNNNEVIVINGKISLTEKGKQRNNELKRMFGL